MNSHTEQHELDILNSIHLNEDATQRELSEKVGLSLGAINLIIKRLTKKGFIKVVHLSSHSIKYFLTPEGIADKIDRTSRYIARTYKEVMSLQLSIQRALEGLITEDNRDTILFYGPDDETRKLITTLMTEEFSISHHRIFTRFEDLRRAHDQQDTPLVITWNALSEKQLKTAHITCENIMQRIII